MSLIVMHKDKAVSGLILLAICIKMIISPWATGDYQVPVGQMINYLCDGLLLVGVIWGCLSVRRQFLYLYIVALVTGISYALSTLLFTDNSPLAILATHLKIYLPILAFPVLLKGYEVDPEGFIQVVKRIVALVCGLLLLGLLILPSSLNRLEIWWPSYFGGLHSTAYVALMLIFLAYCLMKLGKMDARMTSLIIVVLSICIYFGWGVRTATLACLVFAMGLLSIRLTYDQKPLLRYLVLFVPLLLLIVIPFLDVGEGLDSFTSGRLSMYAEKYDQLMANGVGPWLIGNGYGSDLIETDVWWWEAKGAHSDVITMLVEGGLVYLFGFVLVIYRLFSAGDVVFKCLLLATLSTSLFSNGVFVRPIAGYLLALVFVLSYAQVLRVGGRT